MTRWLVLILTCVGIIMLAIWSSANAKTLRSQTDSSGYTHYSGDGVTGLSHTDSVGVTHYRFEDKGGHVERCRSSKNSIGVVTMRCE